MGLFIAGALFRVGIRMFRWMIGRSCRIIDHIVRNGKDLERMQRYIRENPAAWFYGEDED